MDLRTIEGKKFSEVTISSHAFAGDIMPGSIPDYTNLFQNALKFGQDYNEFAQRFMDFFYANVAVPSSDEILSLPIEEQQFWNDLASARAQIDSDAGLLKWFEKFLAVYQVFDFIQDSDVIVSVNSQLGLLNEGAPNTTIHDNLGHMSSWGPLQSIEVGNDVFELLNSGVSDIAFDNLPETFSTSSLYAAANRTSSNGLNADSMFIRRQPGIVTQGLSIIEPDSSSSSGVGDQLNITVRLQDTVGLQHVSVYYQHNGYYFVPPWDSVISLSVQTSGVKLDSQQILAVGLYDYKHTLDMDSTAYSTDEVRIDVNTSEVLQDFRVTPLVNHMTVGEYLVPEYLAIYQTFVAPLGSFDSELEAVVNDTSIVRFNSISKEFRALSEGSTYADVTYLGQTKRLFFEVQDLKVCLDSLIVTNRNIRKSTTFSAQKYVELKGVTIESPHLLQIRAPEVVIEGSSENELGSEMQIINEIGCSEEQAVLPCDSFQWVQLGADIDGEAPGDQSGGSVSMSSNGNRLAIGARLNDGNGTAAGHVRVYDWNGSSWVQLGADIDGEAAGDQSGWSVSLSSDGNRLAIGARLNDGNGGNSGHVRVYAWNGSSWVQLGGDIDGETAFDESGESVSMSSDGSRLAIGAIRNDGNGTEAGHVRVYEWDGTSWSKMGNDIDGEAEIGWFGGSVSLSSDGTTVASGGVRNSNAGIHAGHVRVYEWDGTSWIQKGADIDGEASYDFSGWSVSLSSNGNRLAVGAPGNEGNGTNAGHVRVYEWNGSSWMQLGIDIDGEAALENSGISVSLSSIGNRLAVGAPGNDGNGTNAGHVRVYEWDGSSWVRLGVGIDGEAGGDNSGSSVSMSLNGNRLIIGAPQNDGNGANSGHVRVYDIECISP